MRLGKYLGSGASVECTIHPDQATLLAALPYKIDRVGLRVRRTDSRGNYKISGGLAGNADKFGKHLLRMEILNPEGKPLAYYSKNIAAENGNFSIDIVLGLNEPAGAYRMLIRDLITGITAEAELQKDTSEYSKLLP
jgi:hypothetical protein